MSLATRPPSTLLSAGTHILAHHRSLTTARLPPLHRLLSELDDATSARLRERVYEQAAPYVHKDGTVAVPVSAYFGVGHLTSAASTSAPRPLKCGVPIDQHQDGCAVSAHIVVVASATEPLPRERSGDNKPELRRALILDRLHSAGCSIHLVRPDGGAALKRALGEDTSHTSDSMRGPAPPSACISPCISPCISREKLDLFERVHAHFRADPAPDASFLSLETDERDGLVPYYFTRRRATLDDPFERRLAWHATDALTPIFPDLGTVLECDAAVSAYAVSLLSSYFPEQFGMPMADASRSERPAVPPTVFAVTTHPGHHATADRYGGYCFLNNAVYICDLLMARDLQPFVIDVDYHAGDGTAESLAGGDCLDASSSAASHAAQLMVSLHASSDYPFLPESLPWAVEVPPATTWQEYETLLREAVRRRPAEARVLVLSLGFDTLAGDPDAREAHRFSLEPSDFGRMRHVLEECGLPIVAVQEGGYHLADIPSAAEAFCVAHAHQR